MRRFYILLATNVLIGTASLAAPLISYPCGTLAACQAKLGPDGTRLMQSWYDPATTAAQHTAMRHAIETHTINGAISWKAAAAEYYNTDDGSTGAIQPNRDADLDASQAAALRDLADAEADKMRALKAACTNREAYLRIYQMAPDRDRELLKETCAGHHSTARKRKH